MITMLAPKDFLELIMNEPELLLPPAGEVPVTQHEANSRVTFEDHGCLRCGEAAEIAIVCMAHGRDDLGFRWLDLCMVCREEIIESMHERALRFKPPKRL